ncbi:putative E3 ubiquitin-protein ligase XBAT35 isoform X1 [Physcomitrium patens]|nr:putative E3 ubiquitin-protein ligase XBAT34 isoform X1 [Physcomitrium patens]|eukprot:XP_024373874.1 putative E3 ubiquitin-protein ligase XBAT34 isoform X1 [Physcomitrella patens]
MRIEFFVVSFNPAAYFDLGATRCATCFINNLCFRGSNHNWKFEVDMGNGTSKEEQLYQAVQTGNVRVVKALQHDGTSLEFVDKEGRTPLHVACASGNMFDMVLTLLNLGANVKAYQPGSHGGTPLHLAAKNGSDRIVYLLLSRGADPLAVNDDALTPLDLARNRGHLSVVRIIENRVALFSGMLRELSGPSFLEQLAPQWITKGIWAVVVPTESNPKRPPKFELVIYKSPTDPLPRTLIPLVRAEVEEPKFSLPDPVLILTDKGTRTKYKFMAEVPGDKANLERFYKACIGPALPHQLPLANNQQTSTPSFLKQPSESDIALQMAMDASLRTAADEGVILGGWRDNDKELGSGFNGWDVASEAGPSSSVPLAEEVAEPEHEKALIPASKPIETHNTTSIPSTPTSSTPSAPPSAPPLPPVLLSEDGDPIHYPSVDTSPVETDYAADAQPVQSSAPASTVTGEKSGQCVVCWDAPAQVVCIPCGHLAGCMDCLSEIKEKGWGCPVCRTAIQQLIKVYAV